MADFLIKKQTTTTLEKLQVQGGRSIFFYLSLFIFLVVLASFGGLAFLNRAQERAEETLVGEIKLKEGELGPESVNRFFLLEARLKNMRSLLSGHTRVSSVFKFLEDNTHPQVRFSNLNFFSDSRKIELNGEAPNFAVLSQQMGILERSPQVEKVEFGGISLSAGGKPGFRLMIVVKPSMFSAR